MVGATRVMIWVLIWFIAVTGSSKHAVSTTNPVNMPARRIPSFGLDEAMNMLILQYPGFSPCIPKGFSIRNYERTAL